MPKDQKREIILSHLFDAYEALRNWSQSKGEIRDVWHFHFGWVLRHGNETENTEAFLLFVETVCQQ